MFTRDLLPRYLASPYEAAALSLTCKWAYENVTAATVSFRVHVDNFVSDYHTAYLFTAEGVRWFRIGANIVIFRGDSCHGVAAYAAKFISTPVYYYSHDSNESCAGDGIRLVPITATITACYSLHTTIKYAVYMTTKPRAATFADIPDDVIVILIDQLRDSRPFSMVSTRIYNIYKTTPDYAAACGAPLSATTPAKFCLQYPPEKLYECGNVAGLAYWYRKTGITAAKFVQRLTNNDERPADTDESANWLYQNFRGEFIKNISGVIGLRQTKLLKLLIPHIAEIELPQYYCVFRVFRILFENYPRARERIINNQLYYSNTYSVAKCLTFASMYGVNPLNGNVQRICRHAGLFQAIKISHVLEHIDEIQRTLQHHSDYVAAIVEQYT